MDRSVRWVVNDTSRFQQRYRRWLRTAAGLMLMVCLTGWSMPGSDTVRAQAVGPDDTRAASEDPVDAAGNDRLVSDLSAVNWDEDVTEERNRGDEGAVLSGSWEDEASDDEVDELAAIESERRLQAMAKLDARERVTHLWGFGVFIVYLLGGILTAYCTRNRKVALEYPPELMIVLHTFWPIELLLLPLVGRRPKPV
jgi:uncharacterized membrane protein YhdT